MPRGGFIVLGMLAYVLDLRPAQLAPSPPSDVPLVVTDDCAISGVRFSDMLDRCENRQVIFSHLYSHPDLRIAIERREPRVLACVSAQDLTDYAPAYYGDQYEAWRERWRQRPNPGYWVGQPDHVCFAWNEPDTVFWNPVAQQAESAWRLLPPELCLKNRRKFAPEDARVQLQPEGKGPLGALRKSCLWRVGGPGHCCQHGNRTELRVSRYRSRYMACDPGARQLGGCGENACRELPGGEGQAARRSSRPGRGSSCKGPAGAIRHSTFPGLNFE
jgi:hypothetical protein